MCCFKQTATPLPPTWDKRSRQSERADRLAASPTGRHTWEGEHRAWDKAHTLFRWFHPCTPAQVWRLVFTQVCGAEQCTATPPIKVMKSLMSNTDNIGQWRHEVGISWRLRRSVWVQLIVKETEPYRIDKISPKKQFKTNKRATKGHSNIIIGSLRHTKYQDQVCNMSHYANNTNI